MVVTEEHEVKVKAKETALLKDDAQKGLEEVRPVALLWGNHARAGAGRQQHGMSSLGHVWVAIWLGWRLLLPLLPLPLFAERLAQLPVNPLPSPLGPAHAGGGGEGIERTEQE